jgi:hypothetical protein
MGKKSGFGSGILMDHISERLETIFWVKILKFFDGDPKWKKFGSEIKIRIRNTDYKYRTCDSIDLPATSRPSDVSSSRAFSTLLDWKKKHSIPKDETEQKD